MQFISSATGTTTATITNSIGDLIIIFAFRSSSTTAPTLPAGFTNINSSIGANPSYRIGYRVATATNQSSGTWTGATNLIAHVYRANSSSKISIGSGNFSSSSGTTITYPGIGALVTNGTSWVVGFVGHRSTNTTIETPPTGMINRSDIVGSCEIAGHDTNGGVSSWSAQNVTVTGTAAAWISYVVEIKESPISSGAGSSSTRLSYYDNSNSTTSSNVSEWSSVTSSKDGMRIFATNNGSAYFVKSLDGGQTWTESALSLSGSDAKIYCITSNASGSRLFIVAATTGDATVHVYMSVDQGTTWTLQATNNNLVHASAIVSSTYANNLCVSVYGGYIYTSTDYGVTWIQQTGSGSRNWIINCLAMSDDGSKIIAAPDNTGMYLYISTDYGVTWTQKTGAGSHYWTSLSMSGDGLKMFAVNWDGADHAYVSTNSGSTWTSVDVNTTGNNLIGCCVSSDGSKLLAIDQLTSQTYFSLDNGATWTTINNDNTLVNSFAGFSSSRDGSRVYQVSPSKNYVKMFNFNTTIAFAQHPFGWNMSNSSGFTVVQTNQKNAVST